MKTLLFKVVFTFFALFFAAASIFGQETVPAAPSTDSESSQETAKDQALLWRISGDSLPADSYVFGTIHLIPSEHYFTPDGMDEALLASKHIVFEIDMAEMTDLSSQISVLTKAFMPNGQSLRTLLNDEDYQLVKSHFEAQGIPFFLFERLKPMFLSSFLMEDFSPQDMQSGAMKSYEMEIYEVATEHEIKTGGLESIAFQLSIFDSIPYPVQADMLVQAIKTMDDADDGSYNKLIEMYKAQDVEGLYAMLAAESPELREYGNILIEDRNRNWIPVMISLMQEGPTFFAVGAGHLGGSEGVIPLLRQAGYTVTPVLVSGTKPVKRI